MVNEFPTYMLSLFIHSLRPPHSFVGALGRGPKYLSDEYAVMDTRYWPLHEPTVAWISLIELVIDLPLCYYW